MEQGKSLALWALYCLIFVAVIVVVGYIWKLFS
jgi:heme/copper-type cytochrome/quinol oxidase subunit 4